MTCSISEKLFEFVPGGFVYFATISVIELFHRLYPDLMQIDGSSGALGTAMKKTIESLLPISVYLYEG